MRFYPDILSYRDKIVLRPQEISNNPEIIRRLSDRYMIRLWKSISTAMPTLLTPWVLHGERYRRFRRFLAQHRSHDDPFHCPRRRFPARCAPCHPYRPHRHKVHVIVTDQGLADLRNRIPGKGPGDHRKLRPSRLPAPAVGLLQQGSETSGGHIPIILDEAFFLASPVFREPSP